MTALHDKSSKVMRGAQIRRDKSHSLIPSLAQVGEAGVSLEAKEIGATKKLNIDQSRQKEAKSKKSYMLFSTNNST